MAKESKKLRELNLDYKEMVKGRAFLIKPNTMKYDIDIVLIVKDPKEEQYQMLFWMDEKIKKEIEFRNLNNILSSYNSIYAAARRIIDNKLKVKYENA